MRGEELSFNEQDAKLANALAQGLYVLREKDQVTPKNPIKGRDLAARLSSKYNVSLDDAQIRKFISHLRKQGIPIATSKDANGYFYARYAYEIEPTIADLKSRRNKIDDALRGLEGVVRQFTQTTIFDQEQKA